MKGKDKNPTFSDTAPIFSEFLAALRQTLS